MTRPFCVGLTGGIGSGKSTVSRLFAALGVEIIDTDNIARELTGPGGMALSKIVRIFGADACLPDGGLDRAWMRHKVFADASARHDLERILHPLIRAEAAKRLAAAAGPYVILVVPLLAESGAYADLVDSVLVVDCPESQQIQRAVQRDGMNEAQARAMLAAQVTRAERLAHADDVIDNGGDPAGLPAEVERLHGHYLQLALSRARIA